MVWKGKGVYIMNHEEFFKLVLVLEDLGYTKIQIKEIIHNLEIELYGEWKK